MDEETSKKTRKVHIMLSDDLHRDVRIRCAYEDISIQEYVASLIANDMKRFDVPRKRAEKNAASQPAEM
jgi:predicted DNA binding CopG/RHH family protein